MNYNPYMMQPPQQANNGLVWVQGESGAKSYLMAPGQTVLLMDAESSSFYIKSTDNAGMPLPLRIFDYTERQNEPKMAQAAPRDLSMDYVTRDEYDALKSEVDAMKKTRRKTDE